MQHRDVTLEKSLMCECSPLETGIKCEQLLLKLPGAGVALQECSMVASCGLLESSRNLPLLPCQNSWGICTVAGKNTLQFSAGIFEAGRSIQAKWGFMRGHKVDVTFFLRVSSLGDTSWLLADTS